MVTTTTHIVTFMVRLHKAGQSLDYRNATFTDHCGQLFDGGRLFDRNGLEYEPEVIGEHDVVPTLEDSLIEVIYVSYATAGYGYLGNLEWLVDEGGFFDTYKKEDLMKLFHLFEHKILNQPFSWGQAEASEVMVPTLWEVTSRTWKGHEGDYDAEFDIDYKGELDMSSLKAKNGSDISDGVQERRSS